MLETFTDSLIGTISTLKEMMHYFKRLTFIIVFREPYLRPPKVIGITRKAVIYKKHIYFHCRSTLR